MEQNKVVRDGLLKVGGKCFPTKRQVGLSSPFEVLSWPKQDPPSTSIQSRMPHQSVDGVLGSRRLLSPAVYDPLCHL